MSDLWESYKSKVESKYKKEIEEHYKTKLNELKITKTFNKNYGIVKMYDTKRKSRTKLHGFLTDEEIKNDLQAIENEDYIPKLSKNKKVKIEMYGEVFIGRIKKIDDDKVIIQESNGNKMKVSIKSIRNNKVKVEIL